MEAMRGLTIRTVRSKDQVLIRVRGDLDFAATSRLVEAVEPVLQDPTPMCVIDCKEVTFIDSETLKAILALRAKFLASSRVLSLRNCSAAVDRILDLLGLCEQLTAPAISKLPSAS